MAHEDEITIDHFSLLGDRINFLRELIPSAFSEGQLQWDLLQAALGDDLHGEERERYVLEWAGKTNAVHASLDSGVGALLPDLETSIKFDESPHVLIDGDNFETLKILQKSYHRSIKTIYLDPPYNTTKDRLYVDDYSDSLSAYLLKSRQVNEEGAALTSRVETSGRFHSQWMSMMYPRLLLAGNLLKPDGSIWISIDDVEFPNLRLLCNEIFGEENFVATFIWEKRTTRENRKVFSTNHDYIVCYAKDKEQFQASRNLLPLTDEALARYSNPDDDPRGPWQDVSLNVMGGHATKDQYYDVTTPGGRLIQLPGARAWSVTRERYDELVADNRVWFGEGGNNVPRRKLFFSEAQEGLTPETMWMADEVGTNDSAKKALIELFDGAEVYDTPKPVDLLKRIIQISTDKDTDDIILDLFAGSGTTGHAVLSSNKDDDGNRRFLLMQLPESTGRDDFRTITEITRERLRRAIASGSGCTGNEGFKFFRLGLSNFVTWDPRTAPTESDSLAEHLQLFSTSLKEGADDLSVLFELVLRAGYGFNSSIQTIDLDGRRAYLVNEETLICLERQIDKRMLESAMSLRPQRAIFLDAAFGGDDQMKTNARLQLKDSNIDFSTV